MKLNKSIIYKIIKILIIILIMLILAYTYSFILKRKSVETDRDLEQIVLSKAEEKYGYIDKYTIYGNHLNLGGYINIDDLENINLKELKLTIINLDEIEYDYKLDYNIKDNKAYFTLSNNINEGIDLEKIDLGTYYALLKVYGDSKEAIKYYKIHNETEYKDNEYYTMSNISSCKKIEINFEDNMKLKCVNTTIPTDVYDIVIDPGHGGKDPGAMYGDNIESQYILEYSLNLKNKLEEVGYKVKLTREKDEYVDSYGKGGRAVIPYDTKAKLFISIHFNSTVSENLEGGVEVYASNNINLQFAKNFSDNIVNIASSTYSQNNEFKVLDGVYVRTYTEEDIKDAIEYAKDIGYEPYETLSTQTPYYFMIRETGGIMTHAYVDGRNKQIKSNPYYKSNIASEAYLLELGFINSNKDLENLQKNKEAYIDAIIKTIVDNYSK